MRTIVLLTLLLACAAGCYGIQDSASPDSTFTNPLFPSGADPWIVWHNNYYYYCSSSGNGISIRRGENLNTLSQSEAVKVWTAPEGTMWSREIWAPELHHLNGKWYVYFAADDGRNVNHRMYVIENSSSDPLSGNWIFRGKVTDPSDKWAIDGTVFSYRRKLYFVWSGWEGDVNGQQNLYIARMSDPLTISSERVLLSAPEHPWETVGDLNNPDDVPHVNVNEGPAALIKKGKLFIVYSGSGCWTDAYCLGMLTFKGGRDLLGKGAWEKSREPVFRGKAEAAVYATGHNSFFRSPDGKEWWIVYHANSAPGQGCGRFRSPRAQQFYWDTSGRPVFGEPVKAGIASGLPSDKKIRSRR